MRNKYALRLINEKESQKADYTLELGFNKRFNLIHLVTSIIAISFFVHRIDGVANERYSYFILFLKYHDFNYRI